MKRILSLLFFVYLISYTTGQKVTVLKNSTIVDSLRKATNNIQNTNTGVDRSSIDFVEKQYIPNTLVPTKNDYIGQINWTQDYIEAEGISYISAANEEKFGHDLAVELAKAGAEADGRANLLAMILEVKIYDTVRVVDKMFEKKVTVQILEGSIKASAVGEPIIASNYVKVKMRTHLYGNEGSVTNFLDNKQMLPVTAKDEEEMKRQNALQLILAEYKKQGLVDDTATTVPPLVVEVPKDQAANFNTSLIPVISIKDADGNVHDIDINKYLNVKNEKAIEIVNASRQILDATGLLKDVPVLNGYVKNGNLEIDMADVLKQQKKDERRKKIANVFKTIGTTLLTALPIVAAFI